MNGGNKIKYERLNEGDAEDLEHMSRLASGIVREYYDPIVGEEQNTYMIDMFQSEHAIADQLAHGYAYFFVKTDEGEDAGFLAFYPKENEMYLSKLYLRREMRGKGFSHDMLRFVEEKAQECGLHAVSLNVNKRNVSTAVYEKLGFTRVAAEKNDIGNGYFMDDYVYRIEF